MSDDQWEHLESIKTRFNDLLEVKYVAGAKEHDSKLHTDYTISQILDMAIEEAIDQVTYLLTLREKL